MGYRRHAGGGRRDDAEAGIVQALEAAGVRCWRLGGTGNPDVLTFYRGVYRVFEVKTGKGKLTPNQADIPWPVVRSVYDAFLYLEVGTR